MFKYVCLLWVLFSLISCNGGGEPHPKELALSLKDAVGVSFPIININESNSSYVLINNYSNQKLTGLSYKLTSNNVGFTLPNSNECQTLLANTSCKLQINILANKIEATKEKLEVDYKQQSLDFTIPTQELVKNGKLFQVTYTHTNTISINHSTSLLIEIIVNNNDYQNSKYNTICLTDSTGKLLNQELISQKISGLTKGNHILINLKLPFIQLHNNTSLSTEFYLSLIDIKNPSNRLKLPTSYPLQLSITNSTKLVSMNSTNIISVLESSLNYPDVAIKDLANNYLFLASTTTPTSAKLITIFNDGNTTATNISLADKSATNYFSLQIASGASNPCTIKSANDLSISDTLNPGQMCQANLAYTNPTNTFGARSTLFGLSFAVNNIKQWWPFDVPVQYQTQILDAILTPNTTSYAFPSIINDGVANNETGIQITNTGSDIAQNINFSFDGDSSHMFSIDSGKTSCKDSLKVGQSCFVVVKFGPGTTINNYTGQLKINYISKTSGDKLSSIVNLSGTVRAPNTANIIISQINQNNFDGGYGSVSQPWLIMQDAIDMNLQVIFQNNSNTDASNFSVDPSGVIANNNYQIINDTCNGLGIFKAQTTCEIDFRPQTNNNGEDDLIFNGILLNYSDELGNHQNVNITTFPQPFTDRALVLITTRNITTSSSIINYTWKDLPSPLVLTYTRNTRHKSNPIQVNPDLADSGLKYYFYYANSSSCTIGDNNTCNIQLNPEDIALFYTSPVNGMVSISSNVASINTNLLFPKPSAPSLNWVDHVFCLARNNHQDMSINLNGINNILDTVMFSGLGAWINHNAFLYWAGGEATFSTILEETKTANHHIYSIVEYHNPDDDNILVQIQCVVGDNSCTQDNSDPDGRVSKLRFTDGSAIRYDGGGTEDCHQTSALNITS